MLTCVSSRLQGNERHAPPSLVAVQLGRCPCTYPAQACRDQRARKGGNDGQAQGNRRQRPWLLWAFDGQLSAETGRGWRLQPQLCQMTAAGLVIAPVLYTCSPLFSPLQPLMQRHHSSGALHHAHARAIDRSRCGDHCEAVHPLASLQVNQSGHACRAPSASSQGRPTPWILAGQTWITLCASPPLRLDARAAR